MSYFYNTIEPGEVASTFTKRLEKVPIPGTMSSPLHNNIISRIRSKDEDAIICLYDAYASPVFTMLCKIFPDRSFAERVLEKAFLQAWKTIDNYTGKTSITLWLMNIARNEAVNMLCSNEYRRTLEQSQKLTSSNKKTKALFESKSAQNLLLQLECIERIVIALAYYRGFTCQQTSDFLQVPLVAVKKKLQIAYRKLRTAAIQ